MSVRITWTSSGLQPSARQVASVNSLASSRRCSVVRPSNICTLIIGMVFSLSCGLVVHGYVSRLHDHPRQPGIDLRIAREIEPALVCDMRVGVERNVGEAIALAYEKGACLEMP